MDAIDLYIERVANGFTVTQRNSETMYATENYKYVEATGEKMIERVNELLRNKFLP